VRVCVRVCVHVYVCAVQAFADAGQIGAGGGGERAAIAAAEAAISSAGTQVCMFMGICICVCVCVCMGLCVCTCVYTHARSNSCFLPFSHVFHFRVAVWRCICSTTYPTCSGRRYKQCSRCWGITSR